MKRYFLFLWAEGAAKGGMNDFIGDYHNPEQAAKDAVTVYIPLMNCDFIATVWDSLERVYITHVWDKYI